MTGTGVYALTDDIKEHCNVSDNVDDSRFVAVGMSASRLIDQYCGRQFDKDAAATARYFRVPYGAGCLRVADFWDSTTLVLKTSAAGDGVYETTWPTTDFYLEPFDGVRNGVVGWPYTEIVPTVNRWWPLNAYGMNWRPQIEITAKWGWAAVPDTVKRATLTLAARLFAEPKAPTMIDPGVGLYIGRNRMSTVEDMLNVFRNYSVVSGVA